MKHQKLWIRLRRISELRKYVDDAPKKSYIIENTVCTQKYVRARKYKHEPKVYTRECIRVVHSEYTREKKYKHERMYTWKMLCM
jgi:hypothetical protein